MKVLANRYVIDSTCPIRSGGMGEICKARDMDEGRDVAIKYFRTDFASDKYTLNAFARESKHLQALDHPNIVKVFDGGVDPDDDRRYLVLEWLETSLLDH